MNKKQLVIMWLGIAAILIGSAFPYLYVYSPAPDGDYRWPAGRVFIFTPPNMKGMFGSYVWIDLAPLHIEWTVISVVTIGLFVTFRDKEK